MALDATKPEDSALVSALPGWIRTLAAAINTNENNISAGSALAVTELNLSGGTTAMAVGVDLSAAMIEMVLLTASGGCVLEEITGGTQGQVKMFRLGDANVEFEKDDTKIGLNQVGAGTVYGGTTGDIIAFVNVGGDPSGPTNGVWWELFRLGKV